MPPKPAFLGPRNAVVFEDPAVAAAYYHRPTYPPAVFEALRGLLPPPGDLRRRRVLDVAAGTGFLARPMVEFAERVDALDPSAAMIEVGRRQPNGDHPRLRWHLGSAENPPLAGPYELITIGDALHWLDWPVALPRLGRLLAPAGWLALLSLEAEPPPWQAGLLELYRRFSTIRDYRPVDAVAEVERRGLFERHGEHRPAPHPFTQPVDAYVESFHARSSLSRARLGPAAAAELDAAVRRLVVETGSGGTVTLQIVTRLVWGRPLDPGTPA